MRGEAGRSRPLVLGRDLIGRVLTTGVADGDLAIDGEPGVLEGRRRSLVDRPWVWLRQVHGADVVVLDDDAPVDAVNGARADAVVSRRRDVVLAAHSADCATIGLVGRVPTTPEQGVVGAVHAGWRGLHAGVIPAAVAAMRELGAVDVRAVLGPCIGPECYEFGEAELALLVGRFGPTVAGRTRQGRPALDLRLGVRLALDEAGVELLTGAVRCTACGTTTEAPDRGGWSGEPRLFSHRARGDAGRQALLVWLERPSLAHGTEGGEDRPVLAGDGVVPGTVEGAG